MAHIPEYTDAQAALFRRQREAVERKILKTYGITKAEIASDGKVRQAYQDIEKFLAGQDWKDRYAEYEQRSGITLTGEQVTQLTNAARDITQQYVGAYALRAKVMEKNTENDVNYHRDEHQYDMAYRNRLTDIYTNHITRESLSRIASFGFNEKDALSLSGRLIKDSIAVYSDPDCSVAFVPPLQIQKIPLADTLREISGYWEEERATLQGQHSFRNMIKAGRAKANEGRNLPGQSPS